MSKPPSAKLASSAAVRRTRLAVSCAVLFGLSLVSPVRAVARPAEGEAAQVHAPTEWEAKALLLYKFAGYVGWPSECFADKTNDATPPVVELAPLIVGVLGRDPFGSDLDRTFKDKLINGRAVVIKRCSTIEDAAKCHMVYVTSTEKAVQLDAIKGLADKPVLLFGDATKFAKRGGIVGVYLENKKLRFAINKNVAKKARLEISSQILKLAVVVETEPD
ncbi:MAG: YfiR family protein [Planctomycetes bacterium]|nr:YfiR family protein [Planctomycetota bacterium]